VADIGNRDALAEATARAQAVFHYAAQVAVTTSMVDPVSDFDVNARGTLLLLDALRRCSERPPLIFASTNKVYGSLADVWLDCVDGAYLPTDPALRRYGIGEERPLDFHTPYGCSKGCADQYVLDWARSFGVPTVVLRMSCIYGPHQFGTEDQGWVAHFLRRAAAGLPLTIYGDGKQVRDVLHVGDAVAAYIAAWRRCRTVQGTAFNLGGGPRNAVSLLQIIGEIEKQLGHKVEISFEDWRPGDQRYFVADTRRVRTALRLPAPLDWRTGLADMADWLLGGREVSAAKHGPPAVELAS
jgi:CDP-paratose 2-epimerase